MSKGEDQLWDEAYRNGTCSRCLNGKPTWAEFDAQGIYLCKVCEDCEKEQLGKYRPEILSGYDQSDVDEPIEPEDY